MPKGFIPSTRTCVVLVELNICLIPITDIFDAIVIKSPNTIKDVVNA